MWGLPHPPFAFGFSEDSSSGASSKTSRVPQRVWQNQLHVLGLGWQAPGLLESSSWSTIEGEPIPEPLTEGSDWEIEVLPSTDPEGWRYGSVFRHLDNNREGGRASCRTSDFVRRRTWRLKHGSMHTQPSQQIPVPSTSAEVKAALAGSLISPATEIQGARSRKQTESERQRSMVRIFINMLISMVKRRQLWNVLPLDPGAWFVLYREHTAGVQKAIASQLGNPIDPDALSKSPWAEGTGREEPSLVRQLLCAAVHSRAAYGYAMAAGHMSSLLKFALMYTVHNLSFNAAGGASGEANNEAIAALAGISSGCLIMSEWHGSVLRPCHYVAVDRANQTIVLSIRGSIQVNDVLSDLSANPMEVTLAGMHGKVHEGLMAAATYIHCNTGAALQKAAADFPGWPLLVTGHSMGGGVGAIVTLLLREPGGAPPELGPVRCIGIGPAAVFTQDLAEACNPFMISVVHGTDIVPSISYSSVEGIFLDLVSASPMRRAAKDIGRRFNETIEGIKVSTAVALKPPQIIQELGPMLPGFACIPSLAEDAAAIAAATAAAKARQSLPGTEMEVEIQMQPMERQHLADTDPASDEASGSHTVLPTTYGVAVASPVTEKHEADSRHEPSHRVGSSSHANPGGEQQHQQPPSSAPSQEQQHEEPGSKPLVPISLSSNFSFWGRAPINVWAHPTMQRYRQNPTATLGEQPPILPSKARAAEPQNESQSDCILGVEQDPGPAKPHGLAATASASHPGGATHKRQNFAHSAGHQSSAEGRQKGMQHELQHHSSKARHCGLQKHSNDLPGRNGRNTSPEIQPAGPSGDDSARQEPQGMNQSADGSDKKEARQAAADVMGEDEDGAGQRGDPTPLFPAGRVLWLMTPELAEFASHGAAHPPQYGADQPEGSRQPQPSSQSQLLLNPTLSHAPSQQQDPAPSLPGSLKGSRSAPSLSRQVSDPEPVHVGPSNLKQQQQPTLWDSLGQDASNRRRTTDEVEGSHSKPKQKVLIQRAPQRISSWSQLDGIGGFWSRLPWPRSTTPPPASAAAEPSPPITQSGRDEPASRSPADAAQVPPASAAATPQLPSIQASRDAPAIRLEMNAAQETGSSQQQPRPSGTPSMPAPAAHQHPLAGPPHSGAMPAAGSESSIHPNSVPAFRGAGASGDDQASSWYGPLSNYAHWPLPDDISTGFPHWANVLLGYPPTHESVLGEMEGKQEGSETKHLDAKHHDAKDRRLLILEADRTCWTRMKLSVDMINDHLPDTYLEVVQLL
ncbi:hypothetical protein WJX74_000870 [Apatococcus lobatus]|uniref:Fungal lipase-type domain-containing protein n=1 Tax=Apatococcus lobatus TaxID=904363 RepID=A0AAW1R0R0_9CHLO